MKRASRALLLTIVGFCVVAGCRVRVATPVASGLATLPTQRDADGNPVPLKTEKRRTTIGPDSPDEAMRWVMIAERDENGDVAPNGVMHARLQVDELRATQATTRAAARQADPSAAAPASAGVSPATWTWIGPGNIGGRTRAIAVHPTTPSIIFAGSVAGGIWRSANSGASWAVVNDFMTNLAVTSIVFQPGNPLVMFAATGEGFFNSDSIRGAGIFMSSDGGSSWTQLSATAPTPSNQNFIFVNRLAFSADGASLIAVTNTGLYRSANLGASWTRTLNAVNMSDVKFLVGSGSAAVASSRARSAYYSTDAGVTWNLASGLNGSCAGGSSGCRVELGVGTSDPAVVFASLEVSGGISQVWKSVNGGISYAQTDVGAASSKLGTQGWYDNVIWVDPTNVNHVLVGGQSLWRSTDGGVTFASLSGIHSDHHAIVADPGFDGAGNKRVYFGGDGGLYKSDTVSAGSAITFTVLNTNYGVTQFYGGSSVSNGKIFGGTQDNGSLLYTPANGPQAWTTMIGGDGGFATGDSTDPNYMYGEFQWMQVHRSTNGSTSSSIAGCSKAAPYKLTDGCASSSASTNFIAPILLDPNEPNRLFAGGANLWRTNDARTANTSTTGPSWAVVKLSIGSNTSAIAVARGDSNVIWVGHNNGNVYSTSNGTAGSPTWIQRDVPASGPSLPNRAVTSLAIDPANSNIVYATFGGYNAGNLWVTHDAGATWSDATGAVGARLPDAPVRSVVVHPTQPGWIYAGTDVGVFTSEDGGSTWSVPQDGPSNVAVFQVFFSGTRLVAVTHGRGMFVAETLPANPPVGVNLVQNGTFSGGMASWQVFEAPDIIHNGAANGVMQFHRAAVPTTASQQAVVFQTTNQSVAAGSPLVAQFDLGNTDTIRKRVSVLVLESDFSDLSVCTFWLPAASPLRSYQVRTHPTKNWVNASIYFYVASDGPGDYLIDNVTMQYDPNLAADRTDCVDPLAPGGTGGGSGPNLLANGGFQTGSLAPWTTFGAIASQFVNGVFEFYRPAAPAGTPAGVVLQATGQAMGTGEILTATFQLGNNSTVRKRVVTLVHDLDFSDLAACTFWLPPGQALATYSMRMYTGKSWGNATLSLYAATVGSEAWIRFDNAVLQRTPGAPPIGTECDEPVIGPDAPAGEATLAGTQLARGTGQANPQTSRAGSNRGASSARPGKNVDASHGGGGRWHAEMWADGRTSITRSEAIDLTAAVGATLQFTSLLVGTEALGEVQISTDGVTWHTVAAAPTADGPVVVGVDLGSFAGQVIYLRFVYDGSGGAFGASSRGWTIGELVIDVRFGHE